MVTRRVTHKMNLLAKHLIVLAKSRDDSGDKKGAHLDYKWAFYMRTRQNYKLLKIGRWLKCINGA